MEAIQSSTPKLVLHAEESVAVVIPAYRVADEVGAVIASIGPAIAHIVVVDDQCPDASGDAAEKSADPRVVVVRREHNGGVGAAFKSGADKAIELGARFIVKVDGDGQMDTSLIPRLLGPLRERRAAMCKGNRFWDFRALRRMPIVRRMGNLGLSFLVKAASGHWSVFDPTNGFFAVRADVFGALPSAALAKRYFFEISLLLELGKRGFRVTDAPMPARYGAESSSLSVTRVLVTFPGLLILGAVKRFFFRNFWFDFTPTAALTSFAMPLLLWGVGFGGWAWVESLRTGEVATAGTVMLAALPFLVGAQSLLLGLSYEMNHQFNTRVGLDDCGE